MADVRFGSLGALAFIKAEIAAGRSMPSGKDISEAMGWKNATSGNDVLMRLAANGQLVVVDREQRGRGWRYQYALVDSNRL